MSGLRAGVLGANDGIVSVAGLVVGVAGAAASHRMLIVAGLVALVAGAVSMAAGEYVSVGAQRDAEQAAPAEGAHGDQDDDLTSPWVAAGMSAAAFTVGGVLPLVAVIWAPAPVRVWATVATASAALALTGWVSSRVAGAPASRAMGRNVIGGTAAMAATYLAGCLIGAA